MLGVPALELGNPLLLRILMKADDGAHFESIITKRGLSA
jgi:hypothetical protein